MKQTFGFQVKLVASVGRDPRGSSSKYVQSLVASHGIDFHPLIVRNGTSTGFIVIEKGLDPIIYSVKTGYLETPIDEVKAQTDNSNPAVTIASGITTDEVGMVKAMFEARPDALHCLNPRAELLKDKRKFHPLLKHRPLLIMNHQELSIYLGKSLEEGAVTQDKLDSLHEKGAETIIITCNQHGAVLSNKKHGLWIVQPIINFGRAIDKTGAGDSFLAAVVAAILNDQPPEEFMLWGAVMSGLKVRKEGGANVPSADEFTKALKD